VEDQLQAGYAEEVAAFMRDQWDAIAGALCYTICIAMRFEWDNEKDRINRTKHDGLSFESAAFVFEDPLAVFRKDRIVAGEQRWHAIGMTAGAVLLVVHVYRTENANDQEETIHIISAREANQRECRIDFRQAGE